MCTVNDQMRLGKPNNGLKSVSIPVMSSHPGGLPLTWLAHENRKVYMPRILASIVGIFLFAGSVTARESISQAIDSRHEREEHPSIIAIGSRPIDQALPLLCADYGHSAIYRDPAYSRKMLTQLYAGGPLLPIQRRLSFHFPYGSNFLRRCQLLCESSKAQREEMPEFKTELKGKVVVVSPVNEGMPHPFWEKRIGDLSKSTTVDELFKAMADSAKREKDQLMFYIDRQREKALSQCKIFLDPGASRSTIPLKVMDAAENAGLRGLYWCDWARTDGPPDERIILVSILPPRKEPLKFQVTISADRPMSELFITTAGLMETPIIGFEEPMLTRENELYKDAEGKILGVRGGGILEVNASNAASAFLMALRYPQPTGYRYGLLPSPSGIICVPVKIVNALEGLNQNNRWQDVQSIFDRSINIDFQARSAWALLESVCEKIASMTKQKIVLVTPLPEIKSQLMQCVPNHTNIPENAREIITYLIQQADTKLRWIIQHKPVSNEFNLSFFSIDQ